MTKESQIDSTKTVDDKNGKDEKKENNLKDEKGKPLTESDIKLFKR